MYLIYAVPVVGFIALLYILFKSTWILKQDAGNDKMKEIAGYIEKGAVSFLFAEYRVLAVFVLIAACLLGFLSYGDEGSSMLIIIPFVAGALLSGLAGFIGMKIATKANVRTTNA